MKICGVTTPEDALMVVDAGADAVGTILAESPRRVTLERAREIAYAVPAFVSLVAVFVDPAPDLVADAKELGYVPQFCGDESLEMCEELAGGPYIKVFHVDPSASDVADTIGRFAGRYSSATLMFDSHVDNRRGGTGISWPWELVGPLALRRKIIISGGLTPENVGDCVRRIRPYAVDVRSGVETRGKKDLERVTAFVRAVREADAEA